MARKDSCQIFIRCWQCHCREIRRRSPVSSSHPFQVNQMSVKWLLFIQFPTIIFQIYVCFLFHCLGWQTHLDYWPLKTPGMGGGHDHIINTRSYQTQSTNLMIIFFVFVLKTFHQPHDAHHICRTEGGKSLYRHFPIFIVNFYCLGSSKLKSN